MRDTFVKALGAGLIAQLAVALANAVQRGHLVRAAGVVADQRDILGEGGFIKAAQVDAVGEAHLFIGAERPRAGGQHDAQQQNGNQSLHQEPGASVANEMFQMSACRQVSSTRTTCS